MLYDLSMKVYFLHHKDLLLQVVVPSTSNKNVQNISLKKIFEK